MFLNFGQVLTHFGQVLTNYNFVYKQMIALTFFANFTAAKDEKYFNFMQVWTTIDRF